MNLYALVIEPDPEERAVLRNALHRQQWKVCEAASAAEASRIIGNFSWNLILCDADLSTQRVAPSCDLTLLSELKRRFGPKVHIVITAAPQVNSITPFEAIINGASDYIPKPCQEDRIEQYARQVVERLRAAEREAKEALLAKRQRPTSNIPPLPELVGESEAIIRVFKELAQIVNNIYLDSLCEGGAPSRLPSIFITGETGTGKELVAQIIHQRSSQSKGQFVPVNCSNLTPELAESELFGHEAGAFTGASRRRQGLWELADGGTLFLDEITEAPPAVLPKLLRVLQDGVVKRLGSNRMMRMNVQVIAATNRDMREEVREGRFRNDLYHRLSLHRLHLPPLRDRIEDIPLIVEHFTRRHFKRDIRFTQDALDMLMSYPFPGNVRELENIVCGAARRSPDGVVYAADLCSYMELVEVSKDTGLECADEPKGSSLVSTDYVSTEVGLEEQVQRFKMQIVKETLARHNGNATRAARSLKISRPSLYRLLRDMKRDEVNAGGAGCEVMLKHDHKGQQLVSTGVS
jgi:two-component system response regulator AtoC